MKTITIVQQKGGAGKTMLATALASAAIDEGMKVKLYDGDRDLQLKEWPLHAKTYWEEHETEFPWPDRLDVEILPTSIDDAYDALDQDKDDGYDLVVIDTRPGTDDDTEEQCYAADLILIPTNANMSDYVKASDTLEWIKSAKANYEYDQDEGYPAIALTLINAPKSVCDAAVSGDVKRLTHDQRLGLKTITQMPVMRSPIPTSGIWTNVRSAGPLPTVISLTGSGGVVRYQKEQLKNAKNLLSECMGMERVKTDG